MNVLKQLWLVLLLAIGLGSSLAAVDRSLQPRIEANAEARLSTAVLEVVSDGTAFTAEKLADHEVYRVTNASGKLVGWAVPVETMGFAAEIRMIIGISPNGQSLLGMVVLESLETPGLGDNIRLPSFRDQFRGKPTEATIQVVKQGQKAPDSIDAITGATISSRAVTNGINRTMHDVREALAAAYASGAEDTSHE